MIRALPDVLSTSLFSRVTANLKSNLDRAAIEAVTGRSNDVIEATGGQTGQVHRAQRAVDEGQAVQSRLALVTGRYTQATASFKTIREATENAGTDALVAATSGDRTGIVTTSETSKSLLGVVFTALNARFDSRSLFAGDESGQSPLANLSQLEADLDAIMAGTGTSADKMAAIDAYFAPGGGFETSIYQGGTGDIAPLTLPNGMTLEPIDRADTQSVRDLLKGLSINSQAFKLPPQEIVDWVEQGANLIRSSQDELAISEARVGNSLNRIEEAVEQEKDNLVLASETLDRIIGRDAFEAASEVQDFETRLQAAYSLTNRLNRLSFTNFIR